MIKLYFLIAISYALIKSLNRQNNLEGAKVVFVEFLRTLLLFPLVAITDIVKWATKNMK